MGYNNNSAEDKKIDFSESRKKIVKQKFLQYMIHATPIISMHLGGRQPTDIEKKSFEEELIKELKKGDPEFTIEKLEDFARNYAKASTKVEGPREKSFSLVVSGDDIIRELMSKGMDLMKANEFMEYYKFAGKPVEFKYREGKGDPANKKRVAHYEIDEVNEHLQKRGYYTISGLEKVIKTTEKPSEIPIKVEEREPIKEILIREEKVSESVKETLITKEKLDRYLSEIGGYAKKHVEKELIKHPDMFKKGDKFIEEAVKDLIIKGLVKGQYKEQGIDLALKRQIPESPKLVKTPLIEQIIETTPSKKLEEVEAKQEIDINTVIESVMSDYNISKIEGWRIKKKVHKKLGDKPVGDDTKIYREVELVVLEYLEEQKKVKKVKKELEKVDLEKVLGEKVVVKEEKMKPIGRPSPIGRPGPVGDTKKYTPTKVTEIKVKAGAYAVVVTSTIAALALIFGLRKATTTDYKRVSNISKSAAIQAVDTTITGRLKDYTATQMQEAIDHAQTENLIGIEKKVEDHHKKINDIHIGLYDVQEKTGTIKEEVKKLTYDTTKSQKRNNTRLSNIETTQFSAGANIAKLIEGYTNHKNTLQELNENFSNLFDRLEKRIELGAREKRVEPKYEEIKPEPTLTKEPITKPREKKEEIKPTKLVKRKPITKPRLSENLKQKLRRFRNR